MAISLVDAVGTERARRRSVWRRYLPAYLFLLPNFLGVMVFIAFPVMFALYMSLTNWDGVTTPQFVGLGNFHDLINDQVFWTGVRNTFVYTIITVPGGDAARPRRRRPALSAREGPLDIPGGDVCACGDLGSCRRGDLEMDLRLR